MQVGRSRCPVGRLLPPLLFSINGDWCFVNFVKTNTQSAKLLRMCLACRQMQPRGDLARLTVNHRTNEVFINLATLVNRVECGRSAYLCRNPKCVEQALKGNRMRNALEGGRGKKTSPVRR